MRLLYLVGFVAGTALKARTDLAAENARLQREVARLDKIADPTMTAEQRENETEALYLATALADAEDVDDVLYVMGGEGE